MLADGLVPLCDSRVLDEMCICDTRFIQDQPLLRREAKYRLSLRRLNPNPNISKWKLPHAYAGDLTPLDCIYQMLTAL